MTSLASVYEQFRGEAEKANCNLDECNKLLGKLKIEIAKSVDLTAATTPSAEQVKALLIARETLELATILSVRAKDAAAFERHVAQVKVYYRDYAAVLPQSQRQYTIYGLNLLRLLAQNKVSDFHVELEAIPTEMHSNVFIVHPIRLELFLMEGSYNKLWAARADVPDESYLFFMDQLMSTLRGEVAECLDAAYEHMPVADAQRMLFMQTPAELEAFAQDKGWHMKNNEAGVMSVHFLAVTAAKKKEVTSAMRIIEENLDYVKELEQIV